MPKVLVACPTHEIKEYSLDRWCKAVEAFTYSPRESLLVDNSPTTALYDRWKYKTEIVHLDLDGTRNQRIAESMQSIRWYALQFDFDFWLSVECDIIAPPNTIETMLQWQKDVQADFYSMPGPGRNDHLLWSPNFMCSLFPRATLERFGFFGAPDNRCTDGWYIRQLMDAGMTIASKPPVQLELQHLENPDPEKVVIW